MKKRVLTLLLATTMVFGLVACGGDKTSSETGTETQVETTEGAEAGTETNVAEGTENVAAPNVELMYSTSTLLTNVFDTYADEDKVPFGAIIGEEYVEGVPAEINLEELDIYVNNTKFPAAYNENIAEISTVIHSMNANTFTSVAIKLDGVEDIDTLKADLVESINTARWICGIPEVILTADDGENLVYAFGATDIVTKFAETLAEVNANMVVDELVPVTAE